MAGYADFKFLAAERTGARPPRFPNARGPPLKKAINPKLPINLSETGWSSVTTRFARASGGARERGWSRQLRREWGMKRVALSAMGMALLGLAGLGFAA